MSGRSASYRYPRMKRPPPPPGTVQRGFRIAVVLCDATVNSPEPWGSDIILEHDGETGKITPIFHRAYVDYIDGDTGEMTFTACTDYTPFKRTQVKGILRLRDEGVMWMQGWTPEVLAALAASFTLKDGTS